MARSKNSTRATAGKQSQHAGPGFGKLFTPTGGGTRAYVFNPVDGTNINLALSSEAFAERLTAISDAGHGDRLTEELNQMAATYPGTDWKAAADKFSA